MTEAIQVEALGYAYGDQSVLTDLTFTVQLGGFFIIIGPNGSGKTTLMRVISGVIRPDTGGVRVMGRSIRT